jgi:hypothetical protein
MRWQARQAWEPELIPAAGTGLETATSHAAEKNRVMVDLGFIPIFLQSPKDAFFVQ